MLQAVLTMLILGALLGLGLGVADKFLKVEVDARQEMVTSMLPGYNCGGCGFAGCSGLAEALVNGEVKTVSLCKPSKPDAKQKIVDYLKETPGPDGSTLDVAL